MEKNVFIGIDFSKLTLDVTFFNVKSFQEKHYEQFENDKSGCVKMFKWIKKRCSDTSLWLFCGEFTGIYTLTLALFLRDKKIDLWLENPMQIKLSNGINRVKNDKVDSIQIANYAFRFQDKMKLYKLQSDASMEIKELVRFKDRLTKVKVQLQVPSAEIKRVMKGCDVANCILNSTKELVTGIEGQIKDVESRIRFLLKKDADMNRLYTLVTSVVGVGMQTAIYLLVHTSAFTNFSNVRQLACYCGVAPFAKSSGTSIKGKNQVSHIANKKLKSLLHMCALNAVRYDPVLKAFYLRKINEGKHKMNVLNSVRNKLLQRIWAVVQSGEMYDKTYHLNKAAIAA